MRVSALYIYPIKSCGGVEVEALTLDRMGPEWDRRFMLVDAAGDFITQRNVPVLSLVRVRITPGTLLVQAPDMQRLELPLLAPDAQEREVRVRVWRYTGPAQDMGDTAANWFGTLLKHPVRLVRFPEHATRHVDPEYAPGDHHVAFADAYPLLMIGQASLDDLNTRLMQPIPMNRFRPNLVVTGCGPYAEDGFTRVRVGDVRLQVVKPCERCTVTTVDQMTGIAGKEPLTTLASYRRHGNKVWFGQNCVHEQAGTIRVGDPVELLA